MTLSEQIVKQVSALPVEKQIEVLDFIVFLLERVNATVKPISSNDTNVREQSAEYVAKETMDESFPHIEMVEFTGGKSAVIRGTRIKVSHIVGYLQVGETPEGIATEIIPHVTLPQVYEAIQYYFVHQAEIDKEREENTEEASRRLLLEKLGEKKYKEITGG
jgi:uncharacterized protein (DUF433 family)